MEGLVQGGSLPVNPYKWPKINWELGLQSYLQVRFHPIYNGIWGPTVVEDLLQEAEAKIQWPEREGREAQVVVHRCVSKKQQILDEFGIRWIHFRTFDSNLKVQN